MRQTPWLLVEKYRRPHPILGDAPYGADFGCFLIQGPCKRKLNVIANAGTDEDGWDHVSVSLPDRCPNWEEMCFIKDLFFDEEECVVQYHPARSEYVNFCKTALHLWRPINQTIPIPDKSLVGGG